MHLSDLQNHDCYDEETRKLISDTKSDAQITLLYPQNEEYFYSATDKIVEVVKTIKPITENPDIPTVEEVIKIKELAEAYLDEQYEDESSYEYFLGTMPIFEDFDGYRLYYACLNVQLPMLLTERINGYIYEDVNYYLLSDLGYLVINPETGDVLELEEALKNQVIDEDELYAYAKEHRLGFTMYLIGDSDNDGALSIKDATLVQKASLAIEKIVHTGNGSDTVFDYNGDGTVNITDATEIQKSYCFISG